MHDITGIPINSDIGVLPYISPYAIDRSGTLGEGGSLAISGTFFQEFLAALVSSCIYLHINFYLILFDCCDY